MPVRSVKSEEAIQRKRLQIAKNNRERRKELRLTIIKKLGGKCVRCGFQDYRALQVDHKEGGGHRTWQETRSPERYYKNILENLESGNYQLLCANCNLIKRYERQEWGWSYSEDQLQAVENREEVDLPNTPRKLISHPEKSKAGREGGLAVLRKYGSEYFRQLGRKGLLTTLQRLQAGKF